MSLQHQDPRNEWRVVVWFQSPRGQAAYFWSTVLLPGSHLEPEQTDSEGRGEALPREGAWEESRPGGPKPDSSGGTRYLGSPCSQGQAQSVGGAGREIAALNA